MSKDYKSKSASRGRSGGNGGGSAIFAGLLIGLCIGIAIAGALALYLNRSGTGFMNKVEPAPKVPPAAAGGKPEVLKPGGGKAEDAVPPPTANGESSKETAQRFGFYDILPGQGTSGDAPSAASPAKPAEATPPATVAPARGTYLQAGAFQSETEADNLKAKLALMGIEATIQSSETPDKGLIHRVRIGPLATPEDIDRFRRQLKAGGIEAAIVKQ
jgi:cell division protein FtsN